MRTLPIAAAAALLLTLPTIAGAAPRDRNQDGIPDAWEKKHKLALVSGQDAKDQDGDGLTNLVEWQAGTNPRKRDSDRDGKPDGREDGDRDGLRNGFEGRTGHDAGDPDTDGDGVKDGKEGAGRVSGVAGTTVTIDLGGGRKARATVSDETFSRCGVVEDWLAGLLDLPSEDEEPTEGVAEELTEILDELLPEERIDDEAPAEETPIDEEDVPADEEDAEGTCPDGAVRKGTWIHASNVAEGAYTWLDVVVPDED